MGIAVHTVQDCIHVYTCLLYMPVSQLHSKNEGVALHTNVWSMPIHYNVLSHIKQKSSSDSYMSLYTQKNRQKEALKADS